MSFVHDAVVVASGVVAGAISWFPCGIGIAAHRYKLGGAQLRSTNRWVQLSVRDTNSFSALGKVVFLLSMLIWLCVFFGAFAVPMFAAKALGMPEDAPSIGYALFANMLVAVTAFLTGPTIWRRLAL